MRTLVRASCVVAALTACIAIAAAQPTGTGSGSGSAAAGSGSGSGSAQAEAGSGSGSGSATAGSDAGSGSGSATAAGSGAGSGSGSGSGAGSGSDAPPIKWKALPVDCAKYHVDMTVKVTGGKFELSPLAPLAKDHVVKFEMPASDDVESPNAKDPTLAQFHVDPGQQLCLQVLVSGEYRLHSSKHPNVEATLFVRPWYDILAEKPVEEDGNFWLPKAVNSEADDSDMMFYTVLALSIFFFVAIAVAVVYLTWKYRHRPGHKAEPSAAHNDALEVTWTVIPTIIVVFLFYYGWHAYVREVTPPNKAVEIQVQAKKWSWNFVHENGVTDADLHVPPNTPVRFVMTSQDVLHSFYMPVMRIKQDIVPRRYTYAWLNATKPGTYRLTCAEYCGTDHSRMGIIESPILPNLPNGRRRVVVVHESLQDYERYLAEKADESNTLPPIDVGKAMYEKKGCNACHNLDTTTKIGPGWGIADWDQPLPLADGKAAKMGREYIVESIKYPAAKSRSDFVGKQMPSFEGQLKEAEIDGIVAYIKSLKTKQ